MVGTSFSAGMLFSCVTDCMAVLFIIIFGIILKGNPSEVHRTGSFTVRTECLTSGTWVCLNATLRMMGMKASHVHSNSLSANTLMTLKSRDSYMLMVPWIPLITVALHLLAASPMVRNMRFLDIVCRKGVPYTKKSEHSEISRWQFPM